MSARSATFSHPRFMQCDCNGCVNAHVTMNIVRLKWIHYLLCISFLEILLCSKDRLWKEGLFHQADKEVIRKLIRCAFSTMRLCKFQTLVYHLTSARPDMSHGGSRKWESDVEIVRMEYQN